MILKNLKMGFWASSALCVLGLNFVEGADETPSLTSMVGQQIVRNLGNPASDEIDRLFSDYPPNFRLLLRNAAEYRRLLDSDTNRELPFTECKLSFGGPVLSAEIRDSIVTEEIPADQDTFILEGGFVVPRSTFADSDYSYRVVTQHRTRFNARLYCTVSLSRPNEYFGGFEIPLRLTVVRSNLEDLGLSQKKVFEVMQLSGKRLNGLFGTYSLSTPDFYQPRVFTNESGTVLSSIEGFGPTDRTWSDFLNDIEEISLEPMSYEGPLTLAHTENNSEFPLEGQWSWVQINDPEYRD